MMLKVSNKADMSKYKFPNRRGSKRYDGSIGDCVSRTIW